MVDNKLLSSDNCCYCQTITNLLYNNKIIHCVVFIFIVRQYVAGKWPDGGGGWTVSRQKRGEGRGAQQTHIPNKGKNVKYFELGL